MKNKGFTLVEVMLTVTIMAVGLVATHTALARCVEAARRSEDKLYSAILVEHQATNLLLGSLFPKSASDLVKRGESNKKENGFEIDVSKQLTERNKMPMILYKIQAKGATGSGTQTLLLVPKPKDDV